MMRWLAYRQRTMRTRIDGDLKTARRTVYLVPVWFLLALACIAGWNFAPEDSWVHGVTAVIVGGWLGASCMRGLERQQAYSIGWREGRLRAYDSLRESQKRGHTVYEWLEGELERDMRTLW